MSTALLRHAWETGPRERDALPTWLPLPVAAAGLTVTALLWQGLLRDQRADLDALTRQASREVEARIVGGAESMILALGRMAERQAGFREGAWEADAALYVRDFPPLRAVEWVDTTLRVQAIVPLTGNEAALGLRLGFEARRRAAFARAATTGAGAASRTVELLQGGRGFLIVQPLERASPMRGFLLGVVDVSDFLAESLRGTAPGHAVSVWDGEEEIYARIPAEGEEPLGRPLERQTSFAGVTWRLRLRPTTAAWPTQPLQVPTLTLAFGSLLSGMLGLTVWFAQRSRRRARMAEDARDALHASEARFAAIVEAAPDALVIADETGCVKLANRQCEAVFGYPRAELADQSVDLLVPEQLRAAHEQHRGRYAAHAVIRRMGTGLDLMGRRKDGSEFSIDVSLSPLEVDGKPMVAAAVRDVTERKRVERELEALTRELEQRVRERTAQLQEVNRELEAFTYSVSHDLRAPLRHISGFARILRDEHEATLHPAGRRYLDHIHKGATHMGQLVDDLLALAQVGRQQLRLVPTALSDLVKEAQAQLRSETRNRVVHWRIEQLPNVACDPGLIRVALVNLLSNAVKFTRTRPTAEIHVGQVPVEGGWALFVRDNGVGFDAKYADKLFGAFQRLHRQEDFEGTGVGLATVQRIVHKHGGRVWADATPDGGATFYFTLTAEVAAPDVKDGT